MNRTIKSVFVLVLAAGLALAGSGAASARGETTASTTGFGCCRVSGFY